MIQKVLVTFQCGQTNLSGIEVMNKEDCDNLLRTIKYYDKYPVEMYYDNSYMVYECAEDLFSNISFKFLRPGEPAVLKRLFRDEFGTPISSLVENNFESSNA